MQSSLPSRLIVLLVSCLIVFELTLHAAAPGNDLFADRASVTGYSAATNASFSGATAEANEPPHLPGTPFRSLWWEWHAPVRGFLTVTNSAASGTNVVFALYGGSSLGTLRLLATGAKGVTIAATGGEVYQIAAVAAGDADIEAQVNFMLVPRFVRSPVPGNLLCEPSFEGTFLEFTCWTVGGGIGGSVGELGGADGVTWPVMGSRLISFWFTPITDGLVAKLTNHLDAVSSHLWEMVSVPDQALLVTSRAPGVRENIMRRLLEGVMTNGAFYDPVLFAGVTLRPSTMEELAAQPTGFDLMWLNRSLIEDCFPDDITPAFCGSLAQTFNTVPGRIYEVSFATALGQGALRVRVNGARQSLHGLPSNLTTGWHWRSFTVTAASNSTQVKFENVGVDFTGVGLDGVSVVWLNEPPAITAQPSSVNSVAGGTAAFVVGSSGLPPLQYQWYHNNVALPGSTFAVLQIQPVSSNHVGSYHCVITNNYGAVTSAVVSLAVETTLAPTIVVQPFSDHASAGAYQVLNVVALGSPPLTFQWLRNDEEIIGATNRHLIFAPVALTNAGTYTVRISNSFGTTISLPAQLSVTASTNGGGAIRFANQFIEGFNTNTIPVFDVDGLTKLSGTDYMAQLYAGDSVATLRAVGTPRAFGVGINAGIILPQTVILPTIASGGTAVAQVRAWQASAGESYEEARALGGKFGRSEVFELVAQTPPLFPTHGLTGMKSFQLRSGLPEFNVGRIELHSFGTNGVTWNLFGEAGSRYLIEKAATNLFWQPFLILTNSTGVVLFNDSAESGETFYRARILD